jgi:AraC family transcriptional regulator
MSLLLVARERSAPRAVARIPAAGRPVLSGVEVIREGRIEPLHAHATLTSAPAKWWGVVLEGYAAPACVVPRHEHVENFVHVVLHGVVKYEVLTRGKTLKFSAAPGTTFILPRGTVDELRWSGPTHGIAAAIHPHLLVNAVDEATHESGIELAEH